MKRLPLVLLSVVAVCAVAALIQWRFLEPVASAAAELESYEHRDGKKEAESDIARGMVKWKVAGRVADFESRSKLLHERLGVELDWFGDCEGSIARDRYTFAYNSEIHRHLVAQFGEAAVLAVLARPTAPRWIDEKG